MLLFYLVRVWKSVIAFTTHVNTEVTDFILITAFLCLDVNDIDVNIFLGPFLEVIRSEDTTGPITGVALSSVNKFLSYGLIGEF